MTVSLNGSPSIAGGAVLLTLADAVLATDADVKVSYSKPTAAANRVKDKAGNEAESFTGQAADANDTTKARLERGEIDGSTMFLYFSEALDEGSMGGYFRVKLWGGRRGGGSTSTATGEVEISGNTVSVGLGGIRRSNPGENAMAYYYKPKDPSVARLRDLAGNDLRTPYDSRHWWSTRYLDLDNFTVPP